MPYVREYRIGSILIVLASFVIVVAGLKAAASIIIPFLLALLIAILFAPLFAFLKRYLPSVISLIVILALMFVIMGSVALLFSSSIQEFSQKLPFYATKFQEESIRLVVFLQSHGIVLDEPMLFEALNPNRVMEFALKAFKGISGVLTQGFFIMLLVIFMLLETTVFAQKLERIFKDQLAEYHVNTIAVNIKRFLLIKTVTSLATALIAYFLLVYKGVDFPLLWSFCAFALNFVPAIGSLIAALPAVLLGLIQLGILDAFVIALGYLAINILIGSILEPKLLGEGLGISTLVVFLSLIFWGWVLGPVGMLLSIPLTMIVKIILSSNKRTRAIAILLDSKANTLLR